MADNSEQGGSWELPCNLDERRQSLMTDDMMSDLQTWRQPDYENLVRMGSRSLSSEYLRHRTEGVDQLARVVRDPERQYSAAALDALARFYASYYQTAEDGILETIAETMIEAAKAGFRSRIHASFDSGTTEHEAPPWRPIAGFASQRYRGGLIRRQASAVIGDEAVAFRDVNFLGASIRAAQFDNCIFRSCGIRAIHEDDLIRNTFEACDFSLCEITPGVPGTIVEANLKQGHNHCISEMPPRLSGRIDFSEILEMR